MIIYDEYKEQQIYKLLLFVTMLLILCFEYACTTQVLV